MRERDGNRFGGINYILVIAAINLYINGRVYAVAVVRGHILHIHIQIHKRKRQKATKKKIR